MSTLAKQPPLSMLAALLQMMAAVEGMLVSPMEYQVLEFIREQDGSSQVGIQAALKNMAVDLTPSSISRMVSKLEDLRLIERRRGPDRRTHHVVTTKKGRAFSREFANRMANAYHSLDVKPPAPPAKPSLIFLCPSCDAQIKAERYGPNTRTNCPTCHQGFFISFDGGICVVNLSGVTVKDPTKGMPANVVLGIRPDASKDEISTARKELIKKYHPDKFHYLGDDFIALATRRSQAVNHAYDVLMEQ